MIIIKNLNNFIRQKSSILSKLTFSETDYDYFFFFKCSTDIIYTRYLIISRPPIQSVLCMYMS